MKGKGRKLMMAATIVFSLIAFVTVAGSVYRAAYLKPRRERIQPYGRLVGVDGRLMHVRAMGSGKDTIVLLSGLGVALPSADFAPLMRKLSGKHSVVAVEYFGTGFSQTTDKPRSCRQYVEEIRAALGQAGYSAPYILMPHSISSVYSEYYAAMYPEEVKAIISLDGTSTAYYAPMPSFVRLVLPIAKLQQATGTTSILAALTANKKKLIASGFTDKEVDDLVTFAGFTLNDNVLEQIAKSADFIRETMDLPFPTSVPYFKVISRQTYETPNKQLKMTPQEYQERHLARIGGHARYEILDGNHFIYQNNADRIAQIADEVIMEAAP